jgi:hypothetical protein
VEEFSLNLAQENGKQPCPSQESNPSFNPQHITLQTELSQLLQLARVYKITETFESEYFYFPCIVLPYASK